MANTIVTNLGDMVCEARRILDDVPEDTGYSSTNLQILEEAAGAQDQDNLLWKETELIRWINEAIDEVAIRSRCIGDDGDTASLTSFTVAADGTGWTTLSDKLLTINEVRWDGKPLKVTSRNHLDLANEDWASETDTKPTYFFVNQTTRKLRIHPINTSSGTLTIHCKRRPTAYITALTATPEIAQQYLLPALDWVCFRAYSKNDAEVLDANKAQYHQEGFLQQFGPRPSALEMEFAFRSQAVTPRGRKEWM